MNKKLLKNFCAVFLAGFMALLLLPQSAQAQEKEAYVVKSSDKKTLTFYYDDQKSSRTGTVWGIEEKKEEEDFKFPAWSGTYSTPESEVTTAVFDASFKNYRPKNTAMWFFNFANMTEIKGLENLNTSEVVKMSYMFALCGKLTQLDLSNFETENVYFLFGMFSGCPSLKTIYCNDTWTCVESEGMFSGCTNLKGAVSYDESKTDASMANPNTGYFTKKKVREEYVVKSSDNTTLTFYSDTLKSSRTGTVWGIKETKEEDFKFPAWSGTYSTPESEVTTAVFDASFKNYRPKNTAMWFLNFANMTEIKGLENLNTSEVANMSYMFALCGKLTQLDLSNFETEKVQYLFEMFSGCPSLKTIYCNDTWTCAKSEGMFSGCTNLKGAVSYDESKTDASMANPNTGYFTKKGSTGVTTTTLDGDTSIQAIYSTDGRRLNNLQRGLNIVRMSNGTTQKILHK